MVQDPSDEILVRKSQQGEHEAFLLLYNRYLNRIYNRVKSRVPPSDVEDVTQEIFLAVIRSLKTFKGDSTFNTWIYTIVSRQIADFYRRHYSRKNAPHADSVELEEIAGEKSNDYLDRTIALQAALHNLPDHYQEIILLRFADGLPFADIAQQRGQSLEAVKSLYRRALQAIRDQINGD